MSNQLLLKSPCIQLDYECQLHPEFIKYSLCHIVHLLVRKFVLAACTHMHNNTVSTIPTLLPSIYVPSPPLSSSPSLSPFPLLPHPLSYPTSHSTFPLPSLPCLFLSPSNPSSHFLFPVPLNSSTACTIFTQYILPTSSSSGIIFHKWTHI